MEIYCFTNVALIFIFGLCVQGSKVISKPGKCPKVFQTFAPAQPCVHDGCCPGNEKCCKFSHESVCAPPVTTEPGCPDPGGKIGFCAVLCQSDEDCRHCEKCCFNGCGYECMPSDPPEKPGSCGSLWFEFWCGESCQHDSDCPGHMKCCPSIWSHVCKDPYLPHYG